MLEAHLEKPISFFTWLVLIDRRMLRNSERQYRLNSGFCTHLSESGKKVPILLTSSIQAERDNPYGVSKKAAEEILADYNKQTGARFIYIVCLVFSANGLVLTTIP